MLIKLTLSTGKEIELTLDEYKELIGWQSIVGIAGTPLYIPPRPYLPQPIYPPGTWYVKCSDHGGV